jgi:hypothetical protein
MGSPDARGVIHVVHGARIPSPDLAVVSMTLAGMSDEIIGDALCSVVGVVDRCLVLPDPRHSGRLA